MISTMNSVKAYKTFGLRNEWISEYFAAPSEFWQTNTLGTAQLDSFKGWLKDASVLDAKNHITPLGELLKYIFENDLTLVWEVLWIELSQHSYVVNWFINNIQFDQTYNNKVLCELMISSGAPAEKTTIKAAIGALVQLFARSPIGEDFCQKVEITKNDFVRKTYDDLSREAVAYSLYRYAESVGTKSLRVSDFYQDDSWQGVYREFGISRRTFESQLRSLNSDTNRVLVAELNMGLDSITLREDLNALDALRILTK